MGFNCCECFPGFGKVKRGLDRVNYKFRKARDHVARRYNAVRRATPFKVGDVVVHHVIVLG